MKRLWFVAVLALMLGACASAPKPQYYPVTALVPPMSTFEPATPKVVTPRPPAGHVDVDVIPDLEVTCPKELNCDPKLTKTAVPAPVKPNLLKGKLNETLAPRINLWNANGKQPAAVSKPITKPAPTFVKLPSPQAVQLQRQINVLLKNIALEKELEAVRAAKAAVLDELVAVNQEKAVLLRARSRFVALNGARIVGDKQWSVIQYELHRQAQAELNTRFVWGTILLLLIFVLLLLWVTRSGRIKFEISEARVKELEKEGEDKDRRIMELKRGHATELTNKGRIIEGLEAQLMKPTGKKPRRKARAPARGKKKPGKKKASPDPLAGPTTALPTSPPQEEVLAVVVVAAATSPAAPVEFGPLVLEDLGVPKG